MTLLVNPINSSLPLVDSGGVPTSAGRRFLQNITDALNGTQVAPGINQVTLGIGINISSGAGDPNGMVDGSPGDLYLSTAGGFGTTFYVKEIGTGNTGWAGK